MFEPYFNSRQRGNKVRTDESKITPSLLPTNAMICCCPNVIFQKDKHTCFYYFFLSLNYQTLYTQVKSKLEKNNEKYKSFVAKVSSVYNIHLYQ